MNLHAAMRELVESVVHRPFGNGTTQQLKARA